MPGSAEDKATIQSLNENFARAFNTGDFARMAANYIDDAVILPPGAEMMRGRSTIQAFWTSAGEMLSDLKLTAEDVQRLGNGAAREIGTFTAKTKGQPPQDVVGRFDRSQSNGGSERSSNF